MENPEKWALFDHLPGASTYARNSFCIMGDAAHASTPHAGAGAGFAIEDVHLLSGLLTPDIISSVEGIGYAFRVYDEMRGPRCEELVRRSRTNGRWLDLQKEGGGEVTEKELRRVLEENMKWVWDADLVGMLEHGRTLFEQHKRDEVS
jgi:salicylate hydroxylase